jgi:hypothetical protein
VVVSHKLHLELVVGEPLFVGKTVVGFVEVFAECFVDKPYLHSTFVEEQSLHLISDLVDNQVELQIMVE